MARSYPKQKHKQKLARKSGAPPGTIIHIGRQFSDKVSLKLIAYDKKNHQEKELADLTAAPVTIPAGQILWLNVDGVHDTELIEEIGRQFNLHPLVQEDIANTNQRPKVEDYGKYIYFVMKMADLDAAGEIMVEQVSIILGKNYILSFQEDPGDVFEPIRERLRNAHSRPRRMGPDFLAYLLLDAVIDRCFLILEKMGEDIDALEEALIENPTKDLLSQIYTLKRRLIHLRKAVWPMREIVDNLRKTANPLLNKELDLFLRDLNDHVMRVIDTVETYRDTTSSMVDLYLSSSSIRMNEIMKFLTVISTIFIPLTFITGFYGMNFDFMPEIHEPWIYPLVIGLMVGMVVAQLIWFRRKKWL